MHGPVLLSGSTRPLGGQDLRYSRQIKRAKVNRECFSFIIDSSGLLFLIQVMVVADLVITFH